MITFSTFLDVTGDEMKTITVIITTTVYCAPGKEVFDGRLSACKPVHKPALDISVPGNSTSNNTDNPLTNCTSPIALNSTEYELVDNQTLRYRGELVDIITYDHLNRPVICTNFSNTGKRHYIVYRLVYPAAFAELSYIGTSISILGSIAILLTYSLFKELRTLPSMILMNLAAAFLVGDFLFLLSNALISLTAHSLASSASLAILLHFLFLSRFSWMCLMAFETCRVFTLARKLQSDISKKAKLVLFLVYLLIGWGLPLIITVITVIVNYTTNGLVLYGETPNGTVSIAWINHRASAAVAFVTPVAVALLFNAAAFLTTVILLCKATRTETNGGDPKRKKWKHLRIVSALFTVMGLPWLFGFLALIGQLRWAWYPFIILNATQAVWIAVTFLVTRKIGKLYVSLFYIICHKRKGDTVQSTKNTMALTDTNSGRCNKGVP